MSDHQPFISGHQNLPEITLKVVVLSVVLAAVLSAANAYLALKVGILISASIPAAVLSMGVLRLFKNSNILENNLVQTAASAGEAVAGGIVYTLPAMIIIGVWTHFNYWETASIALVAGIAGVLFSVPLRRALMHAPNLQFPEGRAIAEVLHVSTQKHLKLSFLFLGGLAGALIDLAQTGFKIIASTLQLWFIGGRTLFGFTAGFSSALIGAGYLIGFEVGLSLLIGAVISWVIGVPIFSMGVMSHLRSANPDQLLMQLGADKIRYMGIGAMMAAGLWTLGGLFKPFAESLRISFQGLKGSSLKSMRRLDRTERDMPMLYVLAGILLMLIASYLLFQHLFSLNLLAFHGLSSYMFLLTCVFYFLVIGFILSALCGYFSGLVGVTASPGSAVMIAGILLAVLALRALLSFHFKLDISAAQMKMAAAVVITMGAMITGAAAIANDNIQDLKVGHIIGATPWKQQVLLMLGVVVSALVIPFVMNVLFQAYGIAGVVPHAGMNPAHTLAAPSAALMAAITRGVLTYHFPWRILGIGAGIALGGVFVLRICRQFGLKLSILAIAIGMYLPLDSSVPLFIGGLFAYLNGRSLRRRDLLTTPLAKMGMQRGKLLACGLVAGSALMNVALAIPFAWSHNSEILRIALPRWHWPAEGLGLLVILALGFWFYRVVCHSR